MEISFFSFPINLVGQTVIYFLISIPVLTSNFLEFFNSAIRIVLAAEGSELEQELLVVKITGARL